MMVSVKVFVKEDGFEWSFSDPALSDDDEQEILSNVDVADRIDSRLMRLKELSVEIEPGIVHLAVEV